MAVLAPLPSTQHHHRNHFVPTLARSIVFWLLILSIAGRLTYYALLGAGYDLLGPWLGLATWPEDLYVFWRLAQLRTPATPPRG